MSTNDEKPRGKKDDAPLHESSEEDSEGEPHISSGLHEQLDMIKHSLFSSCKAFYRIGLEHEVIKLNHPRGHKRNGTTPLGMVEWVVTA